MNEATFKRHFLPLGMSVAIVMALSYPGPGMVVKSWDLMRPAVMLVFLINGLQSNFVVKDVNIRFFKAFLFLVLSSLILCPFLGQWLAEAIGLPPDLALGLVVMSAMPTTLTSGFVIAGVAGGSAVWSMLFTMGLNLAGIVTIPFVLTLVLKSGDVHLSPWPLLYNLLQMVFCPYVIGCVLKKWLSPAGPFKLLLSHIPTFCIILVAWASVSASAENVLHRPMNVLLWSILAVVLVHVQLLCLHYGGAQWLTLNLPETKSFVILGSQKTLPIALSVLTALHLEQVGSAVMICLMFHFLQLLLDSWLAGRWAKKMA